MLGSVHDADDALQETLLAAWRGLAAVRGPQFAALLAVPIATQHACGWPRPAADPGGSSRPSMARPRTEDDLGEPVTEPVWLEPYPR